MKSRLSEMIQQIQAEEQALLSHLSEAELQARGEPERWSVKDLVIHITHWRDEEVRRLAATRQGKTLDSPGEFETRNRQVFQAWQHRPWRDVRAEWARVFSDLLAGLETFPADDLMDPHRYPWLEGRPLWRPLIGGAYIHPLTHLLELQIQVMGLQGAARSQAAAAASLEALDDSPEWTGMTRYNLACFHARAGQSELAIELLGQALLVAPEFTEWSRQDPDFASIRQEPGYQALYEG